MGQSFSAIGRCAKRAQKNQRRAADQLRKLSAEIRKFEKPGYLDKMDDVLRAIDPSVLSAVGGGLGLSGTMKELIIAGVGALPLIISFIKFRTIAPYMKKIQTVLDELDGDLRKLVEELKKILDKTDAANIESGLRNRTAITISSQPQDARNAVEVINRTIATLNLFEQQQSAYVLSGLVSRAFDYLKSWFHSAGKETGPLLQITAIVECCLKGTNNVTTTAHLLDQMASILER